MDYDLLAVSPTGKDDDTRKEIYKSIRTRYIYENKVSLSSGWGEKPQRYKIRYKIFYILPPSSDGNLKFKN